jgi:hypothetical protein
MNEKEKDTEEQRRRVRRKLLKMAVYGIPAISTILATGEAGGGSGSGSGDDDDRRAGTGIKTKRYKPHGQKKYKRGLS